MLRSVFPSRPCRHGAASPCTPRSAFSLWAIVPLGLRVSRACIFHSLHTLAIPVEFPSFLLKWVSFWDAFLRLWGGPIVGNWALFCRCAAFGRFHHEPFQSANCILSCQQWHPCLQVAWRELVMSPSDLLAAWISHSSWTWRSAKRSRGPWLCTPVSSCAHLWTYWPTPTHSLEFQNDPRQIGHFYRAFSQLCLSGKVCPPKWRDARTLALLFGSVSCTCNYYILDGFGRPMAFLWG